MANIAVKFYQSDEKKPFGMPDNWPWQCHEIGEETEFKGDGTNHPFMVMTIDEYNEYVKDNQGAYDSYEEVYKKADGSPHPVLSYTGIYLRVMNWLGRPL